MKTIATVLLSLVLVGNVSAIIPVFVDFDATWPLQLIEWTQQIEQATQAVEQAKQVVSQTQALVSFAGDPKAAISSLAKIDGLVLSIGDMSDESNSADAVTLSVNPTTAMSTSSNLYRTQLGTTMNVFGTDAPRDTSLYQPEMALEGVVNATKKIVDTGRKNQLSLSLQLGAANTRLHAATTQSAIQSAQADIARLTALSEQANAASQDALADYQLTQAQKDIADQDAFTREQELIKAQNQAVAQKEEDDRKTFNQGVGAGLSEGTATPWNSSQMFPSPFSAPSD